MGEIQRSVGDEIFGHFASEIWPKSGEIRKFHENLLFFTKKWSKIQHFKKNLEFFSKKSGTPSETLRNDVKTELIFLPLLPSVFHVICLTLSLKKI